MVPRLQPAWPDASGLAAWTRIAARAWVDVGPRRERRQRSPLRAPGRPAGDDENRYAKALPPGTRRPFPMKCGMRPRIRVAEMLERMASPPWNPLETWRFTLSRKTRWIRSIPFHTISSIVLRTARHRIPRGNAARSLRPWISIPEPPPPTPCRRPGRPSAWRPPSNARGLE